MEIMKIFVFNMKKYRKKMQISQMKLAEMLNTSTSYIGEIEISSRVPSMAMVERIAKALKIEPYRLFIDDKSRKGVNIRKSNQYLDNLTATERQDLAENLNSVVADVVEKYLIPEKSER
jgi:transcriptional regulator with XRE-family HTH domain